MTAWTAAVTSVSLGYPEHWYKASEPTTGTLTDSGNTPVNGTVANGGVPQNITSGLTTFITGDNGGKCKNVTSSLATGSLPRNIDTGSVATPGGVGNGYSVAVAVRLTSVVGSNSIFYHQLTDSTRLRATATHLRMTQWGNTITTDDIVPLADLVDSDPHLLVMTLVSGAQKFYLDGVEVASFARTSTPEPSGSQVLRFADGDGTGNFFAGDYDDILVWTGILTPSDVALLHEGFTAFPLPPDDLTCAAAEADDSITVTWTAPTPTALNAINDPRDISNLLVWYSADYEDTFYNDNDNMSTVHDISGNGNNGSTVTRGAGPTPKWRNAGGRDGGPRFAFGGTTSTGGYFNLPSGVMGAAAAGEIMASLKSNAACGLWTFGAFSGAGDQSHYHFGGNVFDSFGLATTQRKSFTPTLAIASWRRYNVWSAASDWAARLDAVTQTTSATATVTWPTVPRFGVGSRNGAIDQSFLGDAGGVELYGKKLSTTERNHLDDWKAANPGGGFPTDAYAGVPTGYRVRIDGGAATDVGEVFTHTFNALDPGTTYLIEVQSYNEAGDSDWVSVECTTLSDVPTDLEVFTCTGVSLELCYTAASGDPDYYEVRIDGGTPVDNGTNLCHTFTGLDPNTIHLLEARACITGVGCSDWVGINGTTSPGPPTGLTATATTSSLELCWSAPAGGTDTYEVRINGAGDVVGLTELCHLFEGLTQNTEYLLEVRACNDCGCSEWAELIAATPSLQAWSSCACNTRWMVEACDLNTGRVRAVLNPVAMDFQVLLNQFSSGSLTLATKDARARDIWPDLTSIYISRLSDTGVPECMGAFYVEQFDGRSTTNGGTVSVGMKSIDHYLWRRRLRQALTYTNQPQTSIAASLVNYLLTNGIPLTGVADTSTINRDRTYDPADRPVIGDLVSNLSKVINGPEWTLLHDKVGGAWSTRMFFQDRAGVDRTDILHSDVEGSQYGLRVDATRHVTSADALGEDPLIGTFTDLGPYPQFDTAETFSGVVLQATLDQAAEGIVQLRGEPFAIPSFTISGPDPAPENLRLGDTAVFHINQGGISFNGRARLGGYTWRLAEGAPETRVLALVPLGAASQTVLNQTPEDRCVACR